jgi:TatD DNase family protein
LTVADCPRIFDYNKNVPQYKERERLIGRERSLIINGYSDLNGTLLPTARGPLPTVFLIDTHAHICDPVFDADRESVLEKAHAAGISYVVAVGEDLVDAEKNIQLAMRHPMIRPAAGLYPSRLDRDLASRLCEFVRIHKEKLVCIGEVGLDYWLVQEESGRDIQREIFCSFIRLSKELSLPLNVHSRSAGRHAVAVLLDSGAVKVQLHAFDGKVSAAMPAVEAGFFFSIPPSIVRSEQKQRLAKQLPLSCLIVESDSPVLGPAPQDRNEPANVLVAVKAIAELKGIKEEEVVDRIAENTRCLYGDVFS